LSVCAVEDQGYPSNAFGTPSTPSSGPNCTPDDTTLCQVQGRFKLTMTYRDGAGVTQDAKTVPFAGEGHGLFSTGDPAQRWTALVRVLDGCGVNNRYWVFAALTTDEEVSLTVTDTEASVSQSYDNTLGQTASPVTDVDAFATCP
jgi:hypothetical protein